MKKPVAKASIIGPSVNDVFFDQFKQIPAKIKKVDEVYIFVQFKNSENLRAFKLREIIWNVRAGWWTFTNEAKEYFVWMETESSETSTSRRGTWEKATNIPMTSVTAAALEKLLKSENPEIDFAVSIGRPSSFFI